MRKIPSVHTGRIRPTTPAAASPSTTYPVHIGELLKPLLQSLFEATPQPKSRKPGY